MRLADSDWMVGERYVYLSTETNFSAGCLPPSSHPSWRSISASWACWSAMTAVTTSHAGGGTFFELSWRPRALAGVQRDFEGIAAHTSITAPGRRRRARSARGFPARDGGRAVLRSCHTCSCAGFRHCVIRTGRPPSSRPNWLELYRAGQPSGSWVRAGPSVVPRISPTPIPWCRAA